MKKTPLRKKSKSNTKKLQDKLWELCKQITRKQYGNICYTCGKQGLESSNWHTGHMYPKASLSAYMKYDLRVLRPQCYHCNINLGGNGAVYLEKMIEREGEEYLEQIRKDKMISIRADEQFYIDKIVEYTEILKTMK